MMRVKLVTCILVILPIITKIDILYSKYTSIELGSSNLVLHLDNIFNNEVRIVYKFNL